ncbi:MAG: DUF4271 domain-containing protein [Bacteroidales bacterium]
MTGTQQNRQDTIRHRLLPVKDTFKFGKLKVFSFQDTIRRVPAATDSIHEQRQVKQVYYQAPVITDTTTACHKNPLWFVTFKDSTSFLFSTDSSINDNVAYFFTSENRKKTEEKKAILYSHLKQGSVAEKSESVPDWIVPVILLSALLFAVVRNTTIASVRNILRFLSGRGTSAPAARDAAGLFQWQSTLVNLASFISISIFISISLTHLGYNPAGFSPFVVWLVCFATVVAAITARHLVCLVTGDLSGEKDLFREYLISIYNLYRLSGIVYIILSIAILYTRLIPPDTLAKAGITVAASLYIIRVIRLLVIFVNRRVSILYLILYLCALEILPVAVLVKYVTGLQ